MKEKVLKHLSAFLKELAGVVIMIAIEYAIKLLIKKLKID